MKNGPCCYRRAPWPPSDACVRVRRQPSRPDEQYCVATCAPRGGERVRSAAWPALTADLCPSARARFEAPVWPPPKVRGSRPRNPQAPPWSQERRHHHALLRRRDWRADCRDESYIRCQGHAQHYASTRGKRVNREQKSRAGVAQKAKSQSRRLAKCFALPERRVTLHSGHMGNTSALCGSAKCPGRSVTRWMNGYGL
jgi:hypothetical protein